MRLENLKIFTDLGRCRSFSQAAQLNNISQSAVSQMVGQLEKRLGVRLVDRSTRPLQLTEPGRAFSEGCRGLLEQYLELEAAISRSHARIGSTVQIAAIYSVGLRDMNRYIEHFSSQNPGVEVHIEYVHPRSVYDRVLSGASDIGLISYARKLRDLTVVLWREEEMLLACSPGHPFARQSSMMLSQLQGQKYIGFTRDLAIRQKIDQFLRQRGIFVEVIHEFDNIEYVKRAIEAGSGVALLPEPMLRIEMESGILAAVPISGCRLTRPLSIVYRRNQKLTPLVSGFIALLLQPEGTESRDIRGSNPQLIGGERAPGNVALTQPSREPQEGLNEVHHDAHRSTT